MNEAGITLDRLMIIGGPGSGKSTLARELAGRLDLPVIHLDTLYWQPGWVQSERAAFNARVLREIDNDAWIIDGNYSATWPERAARADAIIFLDVPTARRLWRIFWRNLIHFGRTREDLAPGCPERLDIPFWKYAYDYRLERRNKAIDFCMQRADHQLVISAHSTKEALKKLAL